MTLTHAIMSLRWALALVLLAPVVQALSSPLRWYCQEPGTESGPFRRDHCQLVCQQPKKIQSRCCDLSVGAECLNINSTDSALCISNFGSPPTCGPATTTNPPPSTLLLTTSTTDTTTATTTTQPVTGTTTETTLLTTSTTDATTATTTTQPVTEAGPRWHCRVPGLHAGEYKQSYCLFPCAYAEEIVQSICCMASDDACVKSTESLSNAHCKNTRRPTCKVVTTLATTAADTKEEGSGSGSGDEPTPESATTLAAGQVSTQATTAAGQLTTQEGQILTTWASVTIESVDELTPSDLKAFDRTMEDLLEKDCGCDLTVLSRVQEVSSAQRRRRASSSTIVVYSVTSTPENLGIIILSMADVVDSGKLVSALHDLPGFAEVTAVTQRAKPSFEDPLDAETASSSGNSVAGMPTSTFAWVVGGAGVGAVILFVAIAVLVVRRRNRRSAGGNPPKSARSTEENDSAGNDSRFHRPSSPAPPVAITHPDVTVEAGSPERKPEEEVVAYDVATESKRGNQ